MATEINFSPPNDSGVPNYCLLPRGPLMDQGAGQASAGLWSLPRIRACSTNATKLRETPACSAIWSWVSSASFTASRGRWPPVRRRRRIRVVELRRPFSESTGPPWNEADRPPEQTLCGRSSQRVGGALCPTPAAAVEARGARRRGGDGPRCARSPAAISPRSGVTPVLDRSAGAGPGEWRPPAGAGPAGRRPEGPDHDRDPAASRPDPMPTGRRIRSRRRTSPLWTASRVGWPGR